MKRRKDGFDALKWAETAAPTRRGPLCTICKHKDVAEVVEIIIKARKAGRSQVSISQTCAMILDKFGVTVCRTSLANHVNLHMGAKW